MSSPSETPKLALTIDSTVTPPSARFVTLDDLDIRPGSGVTARTTIRPDGPYQAGHYPEFQLFPGAFVIEAAREAVAAYVRETTGGGRAAILRAVDSVRFAKPLVPGDVLVVDVTCARDGAALKAKVGCADADGAPTAKITFSFDLEEVAGD